MEKIFYENVIVETNDFRIPANTSIAQILKIIEKFAFGGQSKYMYLYTGYVMYLFFRITFWSSKFAPIFNIDYGGLRLLILCS